MKIIHVGRVNFISVYKMKSYIVWFEPFCKTIYTNTNVYMEFLHCSTEKAKKKIITHNKKIHIKNESPYKLLNNRKLFSYRAFFILGIKNQECQYFT